MLPARLCVGASADRFAGSSGYITTEVPVSMAHSKRGTPNLAASRGSHCFREANKVADILANVGILHPQDHVRVYHQLCSLPQLARGEVRLNMLGLPSIRLIKGSS